MIINKLPPGIKFHTFLTKKQRHVIVIPLFFVWLSNYLVALMLTVELWAEFA